MKKIDYDQVVNKPQRPSNNNYYNEKINTRTIQKRGTYSEEIINNLKDNEIFYDTSGIYGIWMGVYNPLSGEVEPVQLAGFGGEIPLDTLVKKADIVQELKEGTVYDMGKVLSPNAGLSLKADITGLDNRLTELEKTIVEKIKDIVDKYLEEKKSSGDILSKSSFVDSESVKFNEVESGKYSMTVKWNQYE